LEIGVSQIICMGWPQIVTPSAPTSDSQVARIVSVSHHTQLTGFKKHAWVQENSSQIPT
jgi:hypothetical protein